MSKRPNTLAQTQSPLGGISFQRLQQASIFVLMLLMCVVASFQIDTFFTWNNIVNNLLTNAAAWGIVACGMTLVMVGGGFDLSVASTTAVCSVVLVMMLKALEPQGASVAIPAAIAVTALVGTFLGAINGVLISYVGVNPFVVTLSTMLIFRGGALILTNGGHSQVVPYMMKDTLGQIYWGKPWGIPVPILIFVAVFCIGVYILRFTRLGHYIYALGGNENASWLAGVNTALVKTTTYTLCGLTCAVAATILMPMNNTAEASSFQSQELLVIASVIVGGTPLGGGSGGLGATLGGLLFLNVIENLLTQYSIQEEYRQVIRGLIIVVVVAIDVIVRRRKRK